MRLRFFCAAGPGAPPFCFFDMSLMCFYMSEMCFLYVPNVFFKGGIHWLRLLKFSLPLVF